MSNILLVGGFVEIIELCDENDIEIVGIIDKQMDRKGESIPIIGNDEEVLQWKNQFLGYELIITPDSPSLRKKLALYYQGHGFKFARIISKMARISKSAFILEGVVIQAGVNISSEAHIGKFVKVNNNANIMHNVSVGNYSTIAPNAVLLGHVQVGGSCYIGSNSTILPHVSICDNVTIGAGAVVTKNIETPYTTFVGVPAKKLKK